MKMTVAELGTYLNTNKPDRILMHSADQRWETVENPLKLHLVFSSIRVCSNPNRIYLRQGDGSVCLQRVRYINVEPGPLGASLDVVCDASGNTAIHISLTTIS